jgi:hypothetical protein
MDDGDLNCDEEADENDDELWHSDLVMKAMVKLVCEDAQSFTRW